ncbi:polymerase [Globisporangium polare]
MNVTRHNFEASFADLKKDIELPTCRFVAIDTEFTGLSPNEDEKERFLDTLEERYKKVKRAGESFLITQFGLSTVHVDEQEQFSIKTWNFYIFPRPYGQTDHRFLCQASSLQFLSEHGFDFNKFIADGIPFLNLAKTKGLQKRLEKRIEMLNKPHKGNSLSLSEEGVAFQTDVNRQLDEWIADSAKKGSKLTIPTRNSFFSMIVHETVREKASYLYSEAANGGIEVSFVSQKIKQELVAAKIQVMRDELDQSIGFSRVIDVLSKSKKPIVGHNALLDFVYVFNQFYKPLPNTLAEFKKELVELFPVIYDTKHVALRSPLIEKLNSTGLSALFEYMRDNVKPTPDNLLSSDPRFDGYRTALKAEGDSDEKLLCHEAGFDAFMTGVCFLGLLAHDENGEVLEHGSVGSAARLTARLQEVESYKNQLNLMISDERFLDLTNLAQTIDRSRVYRVSSSKRKLHQLRMEDLFESAKVQRVVREGDQDAFVVLSDAAYTLSADAPTEDLTITPYEQYVASLKVKAEAKKEDENQKLYESLHATYAQDGAPAATFAGLEPTAPAGTSMWNRCTIS